MRVFHLSDIKKHPRVFKRTIVAALFFGGCAVAYALVSLAIYQMKRSVEGQYADSGCSLARVYASVFTNMVHQSQDALRFYTDGVRQAIKENIDDKNGTKYIDGDETPSGDIDQTVIDYIAAERGRRPQIFSYMFFANTDGTMWSDEGHATSVRDRAYYKDIVDDGKQESVGTAVISRTTGERVMHLARALRGGNGELLGIVGAVINIDKIAQLFDETMPSEKLKPFVSDKSMVCVFNPDDEINPDSGHDEQDVQVYSSSSRIGKSSRFYVKQVQDAAWYVGVSVSEELLFGTYRRLNRTKGIVFAIVVVAGLIMYAVSLLSLMRLARLRHEAMHNDPITELLSETAFEKQVQDTLDGADGGEFVLAEMDLNGFKFLNKSYGVEAGNNALRQFSAIAEEQLQKYGGIMARGYADHFYYFAKLMVDRDIFLERMMFVMADISHASQALEHPFTPKYGISFVKKAGNGEGSTKSVLQLIGEASTARKIAKRTPDRDFCVYDAEIEQRVLKEQQIEHNMKKALEQGEFYVVYQPKISLATEKIVGAEALVRWNSPEMGMLSPNEFIPVFERNGFVKQLDFAVYDMTFSFIRRMLDKGHTVVPISINMSRMHNDPDVFIREFTRCVKKYDIPPSLVEVEILERAVSNEKPVLQEVTDGLKKLGFSVAMDDFGSGESSLNMLGNISVDTLKFDQNFLRGNKDDEKLRAFITSLVQMAQKLQRKTVFEGVETQEQRDFLKSIKCDSVQGYFYSRPLKENDFVAFLEQHV